MQGWLISRWISACLFTLCFVSKFLEHTEQEYFPSADLMIIVSITALRSKMFQNQLWEAQGTITLNNIPISIISISALHRPWGWNFRWVVPAIVCSQSTSRLENLSTDYTIVLNWQVDFYVSFRSLFRIISFSTCLARKLAHQIPAYHGRHRGIQI